MIEWVIGIVTVILLYHWLNQKPKNFPPGPPTVPFLGSLPFIDGKNFHFYLEKAREEYGPVVGFKFGSRSAIGVCGSEEVIEILKRDEFNGRPQFRKHAGVMFANNPQWKEQRRFTLRHLRDFGFGKTSVADMIQEEMEEFCLNKLKGQTTVKVSGLFSLSAMNIIWAMIAGSRLSYNDKYLKNLLVNLERLFRQGNVTGGILNVRVIRKFVSLFHEFDDDRTRRLLLEFFKRVSDEHQATKTDTPRDFLDTYLTELETPNHPPSFSEVVLYEVINDLFAAGTESSGNTVSFALMYFLLYPEWQEKVFEEIDQVLGKTPPTYEDRLRLPKVEAFLAEVQRCNTIAPMAVPHATTKDTTLKGYFIPKDSLVLVNIWTLLQDKKHWGDPEAFRPERFLNKEGEFVKDPYMLLFGAGPRVCLGEPLARSFVFLFFVSLVQRYKFSLPTGHPRPSTICEPGFTTAPQKFFADLQER